MYSKSASIQEVRAKSGRLREAKGLLGLESKIIKINRKKGGKKQSIMYNNR